MKHGAMIGYRAGMAVILTLGLAGCAATSPSSTPGAGSLSAGQHVYRAPGSADDPWGPYIQEAATRFSVPDSWIRAVMQQESGGRQYLEGQLTTSEAGAMGLMQLMPQTYSDMQAQYGLGGDPYDPHDNIMAGTAYIRQMYDRFGAPDFLAAYNAGPDRLDEWRRNGNPLPDETVQYVAAITPNLGAGVSPSATIMAPAGATMLARADGVNVNAAYVPPGDAGAAQAGAIQARAIQGSVPASLSRTADGCLRNADAAYDPAAPCLMDQDSPHDGNGDGAPQRTPSAPDGTVMADSAAMPDRAMPDTGSTMAGTGMVQAVSYTPTPGGEWAVQVGAFSTDTEAQQALRLTRQMIGMTRARLSDMVMPVSTGTGVLYRARLTGFAAPDASAACQTLHAHAMACFAVPART